MDIVDRLQQAHADSAQRCMGSNILNEAANRIIVLEGFVKALRSSDCKHFVETNRFFLPQFLREELQRLLGDIT